MLPILCTSISKFSKKQVKWGQQLRHGLNVTKGMTKGTVPFVMTKGTVPFVMPFVTPGLSCYRWID